MTHQDSVHSPSPPANSTAGEASAAPVTEWKLGMDVHPQQNYLVSGFSGYIAILVMYVYIYIYTWIIYGGIP